MTRSKFQPKTLLASALVAVTALGTVPTAARAKGGDITKGVVMGLVGGLAVNQLLKSQGGAHAGTVTRSTPVYTQPRYRRYDRHYEPRHVHRVPAPVYRAPGGRASPQHVAFNDQPRRVRIAIQYHLSRQGYYRGGLDGLWGPHTASAVYSYARSHGRLAMLTSVRSSNRLYSDILR